MTSEHERSLSVPVHGDVVECDVVVVGGGPAGMSTSLELAGRGFSVVLLEESEELGGQYYKQRLGAVREVHGDFRPDGAKMIAEIRGGPTRIETSRVVWGATADGTLLTWSSKRGDALAFRGKATVIATGAFERAVPFLGWQLPGVVTPGHALHLATCDVEPVGRRVLLAGSGPFLLPVACALLDVGVQVVGIAEANRPYRPSRHALKALAYPARLRELSAYMAKLAIHRVPIWQGTYVESAQGVDQLTSVQLTSTRSNPATRTLAVDTLAVGYGFRPATELLRLLGVECRTDKGTGDVFPVLDQFGRASVRGVYAAGEVAGIAGVHAAKARGRMVATAVMADLGHARRNSRRDSREVTRLERFARLQATLFPAPRDLAAVVPDATQVCRCEGVTAGMIRDAVTRGWNDINSAKGATRAGMGPCQGRQCGFAVGSIVAACSSGPLGDPFAARFPIKPVPVRALIGVLDDE